jgi:hypothetical protein
MHLLEYFLICKQIFKKPFTTQLVSKFFDTIRRSKMTQFMLVFFWHNTGSKNDTKSVIYDTSFLQCEDRFRKYLKLIGSYSTVVVKHKITKIIAKDY